MTCVDQRVHIQSSGSTKPSHDYTRKLTTGTKSQALFQLHKKFKDMDGRLKDQLHSDNSVDFTSTRVVVNAVDVGGDFNNKEEFDDCDSMLTWIRRSATNIGFGVVKGRSDNGSKRRNAFITVLCERSGKYHTPLHKFKRDDMGSRKCECPFKIRGYMLARKKWKFRVISGLHNHELCSKLQGHPSACRLKPEEKTCISDMFLNIVQPKNILSTLKRKELESVSNITQVYNIRYCNNKAIRGDKSEMQQLLDDNN
ncbi:uncharacterized protein LOC131658390 [Vicia villosa]|uniref:uncharacterized protein LOC131658390 n=1 Tax=Vicia villosa TaxID=3911 RepID=UPI00273C9EDD|nr:uncharacterized protein LOC131658390 [Vicia villosa]